MNRYGSHSVFSFEALLVAAGVALGFLIVFWAATSPKCAKWEKTDGFRCSTVSTLTTCEPEKRCVAWEGE